MNDLTHLCSVDVRHTFAGEELEVWGRIVPGLPGSSEEPAERRGFVAETIRWRDVDITAALTREEIEAIEERCYAPD